MKRFPLTSALLGLTVLLTACPQPQPPEPSKPPAATTPRIVPLDSTKVSGDAISPSSSGAATYGVWCSHLVVAGNNKVIGVDFTWNAFASIKDGVTGATSQAQFSIPAPGAIALLGMAGALSRRTRR